MALAVRPGSRGLELHFLGCDLGGVDVGDCPGVVGSSLLDVMFEGEHLVDFRLEEGREYRR